MLLQARGGSRYGSFEDAEWVPCSVWGGYGVGMMCRSGTQGLVDQGLRATPDELSASLRAASDHQAATLKAIGFKPE